MTQGISSLLGGQRAPGQAAIPQVLPAPQAKTPASEIAQYQAMPLPQLIAAFQQQPSGPLLGLITKKAEVEKRRKLEEQQRAMGAYAQQGPQTVKDMALADAVGVMQPQMARHGGVMHGYSGGGAVSFAGGTGPQGLDSQMYGSFDPALSEEALAMDALRVEEAKRARRIKELESQVEFLQKSGAPQAVGLAQELARLKGGPPSLTGGPLPAAPPPVAPPGRVPPPAAPAGKTMTSRESSSSSVVGQRPTLEPKDRYADIEAQGIASIRALQEMFRGQGGTDPELAAMRKAAYEAAQGTASRREQDRKEALDEAMRAGDASLGSAENLLRLAGSLENANRLGQGLSRLAGTAGQIKGEQRKALESAKRASREERNAIDQLNQAILEKQIADKSGDVDRQRQANMRVAEAELQVTSLRKDLQKIRGEESYKEASLGIERDKVSAQRYASSVAKSQGDQQRLLALLANTEARKQKTIADITEDHKKENMLVYLQASQKPNDPNAVAAAKAADQQLAVKIQNATRNLDNTLSYAASQIPGFENLYKTQAPSPAPTVRYDSQGKKIP